VLRHSYASYWIAKFRNAAALALQMGHATTEMIFQHYREVVTRQDAKEYWNIRAHFDSIPRSNKILIDEISLRTADCSDPIRA
jgi:hypothetical protein